MDDTLGTIKFGDLFIEWGWADYLGFSVLLLTILFVVLAIVAVARGEQPLTIQRHTASLLASAFNSEPPGLDVQSKGKESTEKLLADHVIDHEQTRQDAAREVDDIVSSGGRDPKFFVTDLERGQAMGHAIGRALIWTVGATLFVLAGILANRMIDGAWPDDWAARFLISIVVFFGAFVYYRRRTLRRLEAMWMLKREQMIRDLMDSDKV